MYIPIEVRMEPLDGTQAKFLMSRSVGDFDEKKYTSKVEAADSPVAEALLEIQSVKEVVIAGNEVTIVTEESPPDWSQIESEVNSVVNKVSEKQHDAAGGTGDGAKADEATFNLVAEMFRTHINPALGGHGGSVELIDVQDGIVTVRMMGGCQGCGMARVTLQQGVQATLQKAIPAVKGVRDVTDHAAGTAPYGGGG